MAKSARDIFRLHGNGMPAVLMAAWLIFGPVHGHCQATSPPAADTRQAGASTANSPAFDVASIRKNVSIGGRSHIISSDRDSHFTTINVRMSMLLPYAFGVPGDRIVGGLGWLDADKWDIEAKGDSALDEAMAKLSWDDGKAEKQQMIQALLAERFQLKVHRETRDLPMYALVVAKRGATLTPSKANGRTVDTRRDEISIRGGDSVAILAAELAKSLGRIVVDKTGITGRFDIDLKWAPEDASAGTPGTSQANGGEASGPSIFTAIQEQLGLRLESTKGPVEVIVIDHIEAPSAN